MGRREPRRKGLVPEMTLWPDLQLGAQKKGGVARTRWEDGKVPVALGKSGDKPRKNALSLLRLEAAIKKER